ncbi:MAG: NusG domain II-containing protein [Eubacterium sp.]|nr:NusG domain II-containing protein [Eubacterium sp.]
MIKRNDIILIAVLAVVCAAAFLLFRGSAQGGSVVAVYVDGEKTQEYPLDADATYTIETSYGTNVLVIEDGTARVDEADCPDSLCVHQGAISRVNESIVCLPHKVVVAIEGDSDDESADAIDGVAK